MIKTRNYIRSETAFQPGSIVSPLRIHLVMEFAVHSGMDITRLWLMVLQSCPVVSF